MGRKTDIRFSVVIPCYNEEAYIGATLASLKAQDFKGSFEIIVVDNNCTDRTAQIAREAGVKVVSEKTVGVCWSRQAGTEVAQGEIVVSSDADTVFAPDWLSKIDAAFAADPKLVAVCGGCHYYDAAWWGKLYPRLLFGFVYIIYKLTGFVMYITATDTAFKREVWSGYNTEMNQGGDELGLLKQLRGRGKVAFTNKYVVYTSPRRLARGLWYSIFVSFFYYYLLAYHVNRIFKRQIIGNAPVYRRDRIVRRRYGMAFLALFILVSILVFKTHDTVYAKAQHMYHHVWHHRTK